MTIRQGVGISAQQLMASKDKLQDLPVEDVVVGRDVLELISSAMYVDPMTVYREYIQNAADAFDDAKAVGLIAPDEVGRVDISVDQATRTVRIRDNGIGIDAGNFVRKLTSLGASGKRGTEARGFRGVGRLAGLGYAQYLIFRSRTKDDSFVSEVVWDCRKLKSILRDATAAGDVSDLIRDVVVLHHLPVSEYPERFFEVEMRGIVRLRSDKLMSPPAIADYLSQVAPVPFHPEFQFAELITSTLKSSVRLGELRIYVDGAGTPVYRPHRDLFAQEGYRQISFDRLEFVEVPGIDGDLAALGWVLHHDYEGALPAAASVKGLRLRAGNVQVGENALLEELFPEQRFNSWAVGEIHVIDRRIVPNGRRDHFEQNAHYNNMVNHLGPTAREIARLCRTSSVKRKWLRELEICTETANGIIEIISQDTITRAQRDKLAGNAEQNVLKMVSIAQQKLFEEDETVAIIDTANALRARLNEVTDQAREDNSPLRHLAIEERERYEHFFTLVYECSANRSVAKALVDKIISKISG